MSQDRLSVADLLARLDAATSELNGPQLEPERVWELVKERGWITRELAERGAEAFFTDGQLQRLGKAIRGGEQTRQSLIVQRETAREQTRDLRAEQRVRREFQPYRNTSGGRVTVDG